ncbi:MAG: inorganic diphosphatase [Calditrichaeota bacterium]|nr:inorganic diphosphatase [Calditrichota bacterium]RQW08248.1 MAG: inorganic diphosphatase [Calditrichota bacterium]
MAHLWHGISTGANPPEDINVIIEIPSGSKCKYELDKTAGIIRVDRIIASAVYYPGNYGFIPQTLAEDNDPLDALVLSQISFHPGVIVRSRPIGVMRMTDAGEPDDKILCVPRRDPHYQEIKSASGLHKNILNEITEFFRVYKNLEEKKVVIQGVEPLDVAVNIIESSIHSYRDRYVNT